MLIGFLCDEWFEPNLCLNMEISKIAPTGNGLETFGPALPTAYPQMRHMEWSLLEVVVGAVV